MLPAVIGVSHADQIGRLRQICPRAVPRAQLIGDYCWERITHSLGRRDLYRAGMGVGAGRRLVVINSTWSEHSLLGRHPDLPLKLVTALPADEFAVALVLHPNVWIRHSRQRVFARLRREMDAGLLVLPPEEGWRAALIASDWVVGDHGSTTFYAAGLERVLLLAATGLDELDPASPTADFGRNAERLDPDGDLLDQLLTAAEKHAPESLQEIFDRQVGMRGTAGRRHQEAMYPFFARRNIPLPTDPPEPDPVPVPRPERTSGPTTYEVAGEVLPDDSVALRRWPVAARRPIEEPRGFLAVTDLEVYSVWKATAAVLARTVLDAEPAPADWLHDHIQDSSSGLDVAVVALGDDRALLLLRRGGVLLEAHAPQPWGEPRPRLDPLLLGAAVNVWLTAARTADELTTRGLVVRTGSRAVKVSFTAPPRVRP
ncbi:hypothetical protein [Streptomyces natalensis]|uniref:hypothetical protein n=1 Tax=Streptomyces natalensis TaxID=68242 RepID=UPI000A8C1BFF